MKVFRTQLLTSDMQIFDETTVTTDIGFGCRWGMVEPHASLTKAPKIGSVWALLHNFIDRIKTRFIDGYYALPMMQRSS